MRIAFVSLPGLPYHVEGAPGAYGGAERQTAALAGSLRERGHEVSLVVAGYDEHARSLPRRTDLPLLDAFDPRAGLPGVRFLAPRWTGLHRALAGFDPDVVFQMCAGAGTGQVAWFCRRRGKGFVFATASDTDVDPARLRLGPRARRFYEYGLRRADRIVTQHGRQARRLRETYGLDSIPIGLATDLPDTVPPPGPRPRVAWLGTLRRVKRPDRWLDVAERFPEVAFVMGGGRAAGEAALFDAIRERAEALPNVTFLGPVDAVGDVLDGSWVLLNTSDVEGFPTTFLEAWSREIPVVSLFDPDDLTARHHLGWIAGDEAELERHLRAALDDGTARGEAGRRGRSYVLEHHAPAAVAASMETVLREAAEAARQR